MNNKKGFTLIEVLSVIIIIGILMIIAVPAVSKYIDRSNKASYASDVLAYVETIRSEYEMKEYGEYLSGDELMIVPIKYITLEKGDTGNSPYGEYDYSKSYVIIAPERKGFQLYATVVDETGVGVIQKGSNELNRDAVQEDIGDSILQYETYAGEDSTLSFNGKTYKYMERRDMESLEKNIADAVIVMQLDSGATPTPTPTQSEDITCNNNQYTGTMQIIATCNNGATIEGAKQYRVGSYTVRCGSITKTCSISGKNRWECDNCYDDGVTITSQIWRYYDTNGKLKTSGWITTGTSHVNPDLNPVQHDYLIQNSKMYTGWYFYNGCRYYLKRYDEDGNGFLDGQMVKGKTVTINGTNYSFNANGRCYSGGECQASCNY